jgi:hypothetical protein
VSTSACGIHCQASAKGRLCRCMVWDCEACWSGTRGADAGRRSLWQILAQAVESGSSIATTMVIGRLASSPTCKVKICGRLL